MPDNNPRQIQLVETLAIGATLFITMTGAVMGVEMRYAKVADVRQMVDEVYKKTVQLRVFELELKDRHELQPHEKALLEHLRRELNHS